VATSSSALVVRERTPTDVDAVVALATEVQRTDGYPSFLGDGTLTTFVTPDDALGAWVAERNGVLVGYVALRPRSAPASATLAAEALGVPMEGLGFVARLMVPPSARRLGVGRHLLDVAANAARRRDLVPVLDVVSDDASAVALYEARGWRRLGRHLVTLRDGRELPIQVFASG